MPLKHRPHTPLEGFHPCLGLRFDHATIWTQVVRGFLQAFNTRFISENLWSLVWSPLSAPLCDGYHSKVMKGTPNRCCFFAWPALICALWTACAFAQGDAPKDDWLKLLEGSKSKPASPVTPTAPTSPAAPTTPSTPNSPPPSGPTTTGAQVEVENYQPVALRVGPELKDAKTRPQGWLRLPDYLKDATIYSKTALSSEDVAGGISKLRVKKAGTLVIACHLGYEGNLSGGWRETTLTLEQLLGLGFKPIGTAVSNYGREFLLLTKEVQAGAQMDLRVNKYEPPYIITKPAFSLPDAATASAAAATPAVSAKPVLIPSPLSPAAAPAGPWIVNKVFDLLPVKITAQVKIQDTQPLWRKIPDYLKEADIFSVEVRGDARQGYHSNAADFTVERDGTLFIACQAAKAPPTAPVPGADIRITTDDLTQAGWMAAGEIQDDKDNNFQLYRKEVRAGETYRLRANKNTLVYVIVNGRKN